MFESTISAGEKAYMRAGLSVGVRADGREACDYRTISFENGVLPHVNGSSRLTIDMGTNVLCSVKFELAQPLPKTPGSGRVDVSVDLLPACGPRLDVRKAQEDGDNVAAQLLEAYHSSLDLSELCIVPGRYCWLMCVDFVFLQLNSNALDAAAFAALIALASAKIPKLKMQTNKHGIEDDFEVVGDLGEAELFNADRVPLCLSFHDLSAPVGSVAPTVPAPTRTPDAFMVSDCCLEELSCAGGCVSVCATRDGRTRALRLGGGAGVTLPALLACTDRARAAAADMFAQAGNALKMINRPAVFPDLVSSRALIA